MVAEVLLDRLDRLHLVPWDHDEEGGVPTYLVEASGPEPVSLAALDVGALAEERHRRILVLVVLRADLLDALLDPPIQRLGDLLDLNEAPHGEGASVCSIWFLIAGRPAIAFILPHRRIEVAPLPPP